MSSSPKDEHSAKPQRPCRESSRHMVAFPRPAQGSSCNDKYRARWRPGLSATSGADKTPAPETSRNPRISSFHWTTGSSSPAGGAKRRRIDRRGSKRALLSTIPHSNSPHPTWVRAVLSRQKQFSCQDFAGVSIQEALSVPHAHDLGHKFLLQRATTGSQDPY